jgi:hypothetical protein
VAPSYVAVVSKRDESRPLIDRESGAAALDPPDEGDADAQVDEDDLVQAVAEFVDDLVEESDADDA